jgi:hypothetical protein
MSQDFSGYLDNITPDSDVSQQFDNPVSFPWSCEGGGCNCASIDSMSATQPSISSCSSLPSTTNSCVSPEGNSYIEFPLPSPTNTTAIAVQQIKEGLCPLATGATNECVPHLCGTNPPCQAFWSVPEIEECGEMPCLVKPEDRASESRRGSGSAILRVQSSSQSPPKKMRHTSGDRSSTRSHKTNSDSEPVTTVLVSVPDGSPSPETNQTRKSEVLQTAIDYVNQTQLEMRHMTNDINRLNTRVRALEKLVKCEDCTLLKGFDGLKVLGGGGAGGGSGMGMNFNGVGAEYGLAAPSAG